MTLSVKLMEEEPTNSSAVAAGAAVCEPEEHLERGDGMRIARQALLREAMRYGGQSVLVLALLGAIGYAGYWSLSEMRFLPKFLQALAKPFGPSSSATSGDRSAAGAAKIAAEKAALKVPARRHRPHTKNVQIAAKVGHRSNIVSSGDPTGGHIIYQDGMITQYSWDK